MSNLLLSKIGHVISEFPWLLNNERSQIIHDIAGKKRRRDAGREFTVP